MKLPAMKVPAVGVPAPLRRAVGALALVLAVLAVLFVVFPTSAYLAQRRDLAETSARLELLVEQNRRLEERARLLQSDAEIERLAREQYNLVKEGEEAYAILPAPEPPPPPPAEGGGEPPWWERAWDQVTGAF